MKINFYEKQTKFYKDIPGINIILSPSTIQSIFDWFNTEIQAIQVQKEQKDEFNKIKKEFLIICYEARIGEEDKSKFWQWFLEKIRG